MSQSLNTILTLSLLIPLWILLSRDFIKGLSYAVFLCVLMPTHLRIQMPGNLPQLTIYRLALIIVFLFWLRYRDPNRKLSRAPLFGLFCFWGLANLISLLLTTSDFIVGLKRFLDFVIEAALFFFLIVTSLRDNDDVLRILRAVCLGITIVAALAFVERYTSFNPVDFLWNPGQSGAETDFDDQTQRRRGDIIATYQHRILLGTGMAMGWPLVIAMKLVNESRQRKFTAFWLALALLLASCYFAGSRGPLLATVLAGALLWLLGRAAIRRKLRLLVLAALVVFVARPGVRSSLVKSAEITTEVESFKGGTFLYRLELWNVAWTKITRSPIQFLFGYGPGCGLASTVDWQLTYRDGQEEKIWSWDSQLAYDLYQSGIIGLTASLALYGGVLLMAFRIWKQANPQAREVMLCLLASLLAYVFMLTNVLMFTKPVNFLFWSIAAISCAIGLNHLEQEAVEDRNARDGSLSELPPRP